MDNKAFTLSELLVVIVVLAIIAIITVPFITGIIGKARQDAFINSAYSLIDAANDYRTNATLNHENRTLNIDFSKSLGGLKISGKAPDSGNLTMDKNGNITFKAWSDKAGICIYKKIDSNKIEVVKVTKENCHL